MENDNDDIAVVESRIGSATCIHKKSSFNILKDMLNESLKGISQKFEEEIRTQSRKTTEQNKEQCKEIEKHMKEMKETMKLQHRETRRRLERLEKKTNSGYYN